MTDSSRIKHTFFRFVKPGLQGNHTVHYVKRSCSDWGQLHNCPVLSAHFFKTNTIKELSNRSQTLIIKGILKRVNPGRLYDRNDNTIVSLISQWVVWSQWTWQPMYLDMWDTKDAYSELTSANCHLHFGTQGRAAVNEYSVKITSLLVLYISK